MRFERQFRRVLRPVTGRRLSAARRALQRQADAVALFPELQPTETPADRCRRFDDESQTTLARWRNLRAAAWKRARRQFRSLPADQRAETARRFWGNRFMPKDPAYLLDIMHQLTHQTGL